MQGVKIWNDIELSASDLVRSLHGWWVAECRENGLPDRADFDPTRFVALLPNILISEVELDPFRIRYRLLGTKVVEVTRLDFTGWYLDELIDQSSDTPWLDLYASAYAARLPILGSVTQTTTVDGTFTYEFGMFPVTGGGDEVRQFISVEDYFGSRFIFAELIPWKLRDQANDGQE